MKKFLVILIAVLMILLTPAFAAEYTEINQTADPMAVKGKSIDTEIESQISKNGTSSTDTEQYNRNTKYIYRLYYGRK